MEDPAGEKGTSSCCCDSPESDSSAQVGHLGEGPEPAALPTGPASIPECPICFSAYDGAFHAPLQLPRCAHTFCLVCVSRMSLFPSPPQGFQCPLCRTPVPLPPGGAPCLPPNMELLSRLPQAHCGAPKRVWLEGPVLCYWTGPEEGGATADGVARLPLTGVPAAGVAAGAGVTPGVRVGAGAGAGGEGQPVAMVTVLSRRRLGGCRNVRGLAVISFLLFVIIFVAIFLPVYFHSREPTPPF
ncbi:RING finger protein 223-like [Anguilla anguilla]|uniref:RING finger protein 223-like n=1 Tax=Anguilla anguilla TaxID=7936 RepID=UPI0015B185AB|nr:RING finger protein 223-like [Anguilla anguilla]